MVRIPPNLPRRSLFLVMAFVCCVLRGSMPAQDFIRGDQTGDGLVGVNDVVHLMNYLYTGGPAATNGCGGPFTFDISDVNDNEFLTIADPLKMGEALFIMGTIPEPYPACGPDPTSGSAGFDQVDPAYVVRTVGPYDGVDTSGVVPVRTAGFEVALEIPGPVRAVEFYFGYDPAELSNPQYEGDLPLGVDVVAFGVLRVTLTSALDPLDLPAGIQRLGRIVFEVAPGL